MNGPIQDLGNLTLLTHILRGQGLNSIRPQLIDYEVIIEKTHWEQSQVYLLLNELMKKRSLLAISGLGFLLLSKPISRRRRRPKVSEPLDDIRRALKTIEAAVASLARRDPDSAADQIRQVIEVLKTSAEQQNLCIPHATLSV